MQSSELRKWIETIAVVISGLGVAAIALAIFLR